MKNAILVSEIEKNDFLFIKEKFTNSLNQNWLYLCTTKSNVVKNKLKTTIWTIWMKQRKTWSLYWIFLTKKRYFGSPNFQTEQIPQQDSQPPIVSYFWIQCIKRIFQMSKNISWANQTKTPLQRGNTKGIIDLLKLDQELNCFMSSSKLFYMSCPIVYDLK